MRRARKRFGNAGFTLIELMIVMTILLVLVSISIPAYERSILRTHETALREELFGMRQALALYWEDKQERPQSLQELVSTGYLKILPRDPITGSSDTWVGQTLQQSDQTIVTNEESFGIVDVHSGSKDIATDGRPYSEW